MPDTDRSVTRITRSVLNTVLEGVGRVASKVQQRRPLRWDLLENDDAYLLIIDAPGADPHDIDVRYIDGGLTVRVERFREYREGYSMRFPGRGLSLHGDIDLPADAVINPDAATATLHDDGTLHIRLPKETVDNHVTTTEQDDE